MFILTEKNSVANHFISELRCIDVQKDSMRFRRNMERLGEIMAYEISKSFEYIPQNVTTPLGIANAGTCLQHPVLATILRAGLPFYQGFLNYYDKSESAFIAAYRSPEAGNGDFEIKMEYIATPSLENKTLIIIDPMLATGKSVLLTYKSMLKYGIPSKVHLASVIASRQGVDYLKDNIENLSLWVGAVDEILNKKSYIVPGLGDAGDLAYGDKL
jgi:uracil phosphoribosyltransferase